MSLLDALLLEPYRDPHEVYIALRSDGQRGSGTMSDPYDGSVRFGPPVSTTVACDPREVVLSSSVEFPNTSDPVHGNKIYRDGQWKIISNVAGLAADEFNLAVRIKVLPPTP